MTGTSTIPRRIVMADDHPPMRATVRSALEGEEFLVVGEAGDAEGAVSLVRDLEPDIALLDVRMPGGGIAAAATIKSEGMGAAVVMLTVSEEDEDLFAALRVGAVGYVLKGKDPADLPGLLRKAVVGEPILDGPLLARVLKEFQQKEGSRPSKETTRGGLSRREHEVLSLLEQGATTAEISAKLFIAKVTVRSHVAAICRKLHLPDRRAALLESRPGAPSPPTAPPGSGGHS